MRPVRPDRSTLASALAGLIACGALIACSYAVPDEAAADGCLTSERTVAGACP